MIQELIGEVLMRLGILTVRRSFDLQVVGRTQVVAEVCSFEIGRLFLPNFCVLGVLLQELVDHLGGLLSRMVQTDCDNVSSRIGSRLESVSQAVDIWLGLDDVLVTSVLARAVMVSVFVAEVVKSLVQTQR